MATDRFVYWMNPRKRPKQDDVRKLLEDFLGGCGAVTWPERLNRWIVTLPGRSSLPFCRLRKDSITHARQENLEPRRLIEVYLDPTYVDVITRFTDPFTDALAERIADCFAEGWPSRRDDEQS